MKIGGQYDNPFIQKKNWEKFAVDIGVKAYFLIQQLKNTAEIVLNEAEKLVQEIDTPSIIYQQIYAVILQQVAKIRKF